MELEKFLELLAPYPLDSRVKINADYDGSPFLSIWNKDELLVEWTFNTEMYPCNVTGLGVTKEESELYGKRI